MVPLDFISLVLKFFCVICHGFHSVSGDYWYFCKANGFSPNHSNRTRVMAPCCPVGMLCALKFLFPSCGTLVFQHKCVRNGLSFYSITMHVVYFGPLYWLNFFGGVNLN